jgi:hypothetical protein
MYLRRYFAQNVPDTITPVGDTETCVFRFSLPRFALSASHVALPASAAIPTPPYTHVHAVAELSVTHLPATSCAHDPFFARATLIAATPATPTAANALEPMIAEVGIRVPSLRASFCVRLLRVPRSIVGVR